MEILTLDTCIDGKNITTLAATIEGPVLVGVVELIYLKRRIAAIRRLFVHPGFRMQGIGRKLVEECCDVALMHGHCEALSLLVDLKNTDALSFYTRIGFRCCYQDDDDWILSKQLG